MANIIGVDYYRVVAETGGGEWSQVYVKTAFDKEEAEKFGAVFGVVKISGEGDLLSKGTGLIAKIEAFVGEEKNKGDLTGILNLLKEEAAEGAFVWMLVSKGGGRRMKAGAMPGNSVAIVRGGVRIWLSEQFGKVVVGDIKDKDVLYLGNKEAVDLIDAEANEVKEMEALTEGVSAKMMKLTEGARAAMILTVKGLPAEIADEEETKVAAPVVTSAVTTAVTPIDSSEEQPDYKEEVLTRLSKRQEEELVGERVVGTTGFSGKLAEAKLSWKDLSSKWSNASKLPADESTNKRKKLFLLAGFVFLIILAISVGFGYLKIRKDNAVAKYNSVFEPLEKKREEAVGLYSLNPVGARDLLRSVKEELGAKKGDFAGTEFEDDIAAFETKVNESWEQVSGEQKASLDLFFDLGLVRSQMKGDRLAFNGADLLVLDIGSGIVAKVGYPDKKQAVMLGKGENSNWIDVTGLASNNVLLRRGGLVGVLSGEQKELTFDAAVLDPVAVESFTGATYVLDKGASEIWRFGLSGGTIGERRRWLLSGVEADLSDGVDLAIDTDIWVAAEKGKVMRFRRGQEERFSLSDAPENFKIKRLAVSDLSSQIAALDPESGRIVLFSKETGAFSKQIIANELSGATDLVFVSEKEILILSGDKLYLTSI